MNESRAETKKRLILFVGLTIGLAWIIFLMIPLCGLTYGSGMSVAILMAGMFVPALSSVLTRVLTKEGFHRMYLRPNFKGHGKQYLLVFFGPTLLLLFSGVFYFLLFPGSFDPELSLLKDMLASSGKTGISAPALLLVQTLQMILIGPIVNIIPTMGEELGWRGYLLPKLRVLLPDRGALVVTGAIWGIWHAPVIAMGHNYGTEYWGYPWLGILAMVVFCVVFGTIEGYVAIKLESAIPAAMIHSALNAGAGLPLYLVKSGYNPLLGPTVAGLIGGLPFIALAVVLLAKVRGLRNSDGLQQAGITDMM